jgi:hypothetical protein
VGLVGFQAGTAFVNVRVSLNNGNTYSALKTDAVFALYQVRFA